LPPTAYAERKPLLASITPHKTRKTQIGEVLADRLMTDHRVYGTAASQGSFTTRHF